MVLVSLLAVSIVHIICLYLGQPFDLNQYWQLPLVFLIIVVVTIFILVPVINKILM